MEIAREADLEDDRYREGLEAGMLKAAPGMRITSAKRSRFAGVPALEIRFEGTVGASPLRIRAVVLIADRRLYRLSVAERGEDAKAEPALERTVASFRFLSEPSTPAEYNSLAFRLGESIGLIAFVAAALGIAIAVRKLDRR